MRGWLLGLYLFYMSLCCTFFPAPTAWLILLMASPIVGMFESEIMTILAVAAIGATGTAIANLNEYHIFTFLLRYGKVHKVRQTRLFSTAKRWFSVSPFSLVALFSFLPVPVDAVRWLAISCRYSRLRYAGANFLGRLFRYGLLAAAATCLAIGWGGILGIQIALVVVVIIRYLPRLIYKKDLSRDTLPRETDTPGINEEGAYG